MLQYMAESWVKDAKLRQNAHADKLQMNMWRWINNTRSLFFSPALQRHVSRGPSSPIPSPCPGRVLRFQPRLPTRQRTDLTTIAHGINAAVDVVRAFEKKRRTE